MAAPCELFWDADDIVRQASGRNDRLNIPLSARGETAVVPLGQIRVFHEAKEKIGRFVGLSPRFIICADKAANAFAGSTPEGDVMAVTLGMLPLANGEIDVAAAVVGHELAHHVRHHGEAGKTRDNALGLLGLLAGIALEYKIQQRYGVEKLGLRLGMAGAELVSLKFTRDQEREADDLGFQYALSQGYNPIGAIRLAERLMKVMPADSSIFSTHPGWDERVELSRARIAGSPQAQQVIARASAGRAGSAGDQVASAGTGPTVPPVQSYQTPDRQQGFQRGLVLYRQGKYGEALDQWRGPAAQGDALAQWAMGYLYENGQGTRPNHAEAVSWYKLAADQRLAAAQFSLGRLYELGRGLAQSDNNAAAMYAYASEAGSTSAMLALGRFYERGRGVPVDQVRSFELYKKASERGDPAAHQALGRAYDEGVGVAKDSKQALDLIRKAAQGGLVTSQLLLGQAYLTGTPEIAKDEEEAVSWFKKAAYRNYPPALYQLGSAHENGLGTPADVDTARAYYAGASKGGFRDADIALARLGARQALLDRRQADQEMTDRSDADRCDRFAALTDMPERGIRRAIDGFIDVDQALPSCAAALKKEPASARIRVQLARIYFQQGKFVEGVRLAQASAKAQPAALPLLAFAQYRGLGSLPANAMDAAGSLKQAVGLGVVEALAPLSAAHERGLGVPVDQHEAYMLLQRAADAGDTEALFHLAQARNAGRLGLPAEPDVAIRLMQQAADDGYPLAQLGLALMLRAREKQASPEARRYLGLAKPQIERLARQGSAEARAALGTIYELGLGAPKDLAMAVEQYRMAADHGSVNAMSRLGAAYVDGAGIDKDAGKGRQWLEKAARLGSEEAGRTLKTLAGV